MSTLLLVGAGHAHAQVLLKIAQSKNSNFKNIEVILVSPFEQAPYSGMVPGWLAGHYSWDECCIDFARLCEFAAARFIKSSAVGIDRNTKKLILEDGSQLHYDWLSLNIGSTIYFPEAGEGITVLPMRPLSDLNSRWETLLNTVTELSKNALYRVAIIGGGVAGVESILAVHHQLTKLAPTVHFEFTLATKDTQIVPGIAKGAVRRLENYLAHRKIIIKRNFTAIRMHEKKIIASSGDILTADAALWATGAQAYAWPKDAGLMTDQNGFIGVDAMLRSTSHANIFASGDCASWVEPLPKAGVYAVRMGEVLTDNLLAVITDKPLRKYRPQRNYLVLIGTGDSHAIASWNKFSWEGTWVWRWKQYIDRKFVRRFYKR